MNQIKGIAIRNRPRSEMQLIDSAQISVDCGMLGDYRGSLRNRQITILSEAGWRKACDSVGADLPWTTRRANLLVDCEEFDESFIDRRIRIGTVELVITRETTPCSMMDAQHQGLTSALESNWRGGICCNVKKPGHIHIGDQVEFV